MGRVEEGPSDRACMLLVAVGLASQGAQRGLPLEEDAHPPTPQSAHAIDFYSVQLPSYLACPSLPMPGSVCVIDDVGYLRVCELIVSVLILKRLIISWRK